LEVFPVFSPSPFFSDLSTTLQWKSPRTAPSLLTSFFHIETPPLLPPPQPFHIMLERGLSACSRLAFPVLDLFGPPFFRKRLEFLVAFLAVDFRADLGTPVRLFLFLICLCAGPPQNSSTDFPYPPVLGPHEYLFAARCLV